MKKNIVIIIISILVLAMGSYLVYDKLIATKEKNEVKVEENNVEKEEEKNNNEVVTKELKNYDSNSIINIVVSVPILGSNDPEMNSVTIEDKEEIKEILLNVDDKEEVGKVPDEIGFISNVTITINYEGDPSTKIIILSNGNVAINSAVGAGETGYGEYKIENKNLASELTNKYQVKE